MTNTFLLLLSNNFIQQWKFGCDGKYSESKENLATNRGNTIPTIPNSTTVLVEILCKIYSGFIIDYPFGQNSNCCCVNKNENNGDARGTSPSRPEMNDANMPWFHGKITREEAESLLTPREVN